jgi:AraC-like DNA-binding protein
VACIRQHSDDSRRSAQGGVLAYDAAVDGSPLHLRCEFVFFERTSPSQNGQLYRHPAPAWTRIFIIVKGWAEITLAGKRTVLQAPGVYLLPTSLPFHARYRIDEVYAFHLHLTDGGGLSATAGVDRILACTAPAEVDELVRLCRSPEPLARQTGVFHAVMRMLDPFLAPARPADPGPFRHLIAIIRTGAADALTVDDLARLAGMPRTTLLRRFRRAYGLPLRDYLLRARIEEAKRRVVFSDEPVAAIAERLGFTDRHYFFRCFRRIAGASLARYRRQHGGLDARP